MNSYKYRRFIMRLNGVLSVVLIGLILVGIVLTLRPATSASKTMETVSEVVDIVPTVEAKAAEVTAETAKAYDATDLELLALVIYQEAGSDACSDLTRQLVGEVALNRVADPRFPDNLHDVLVQRAQYGRLYWTGIKWPERAFAEQEAHAVTRAYNIAEALLTGTATRLLPADTIFQSEHIQGDEIVAFVDGFYFCRG